MLVLAKPGSTITLLMRWRFHPQNFAREFIIRDGNIIGNEKDYFGTDNHEFSLLEPAVLIELQVNHFCFFSPSETLYSTFRMVLACVLLFLLI